MKKISLSVAIMLVFIAYSFQQRSDSTSAVITPKQTNSSSGTMSSNMTQTNQNTTATHSSMMNNTTYKDGSYTGNATNAFYGYIQVKAVISGGKITDVQFLQYPQDQENSIAINSQAMPYLKQEAIQAQSANVSGVTGATDTSQAFVQSLASALSKAQQS